ncbi:glycoside hydrolase family 36 protein [Phytoactinopolyspora endophytica]|uniref:glycoside hydrolase family 36 protein n=1 Tax=Phytoactinopolyspora endophytica TaxID=1642495 RepID=UPI00101BE383|nr:glycoside hydrolase family 36 protein [Phytoactinopolyspora endophytica]
MPTSSSTDTAIHWGHAALSVVVAVSDDAPPRLARLDDGAAESTVATTPDTGDVPDGDTPGSGQPLVEVRAVGHGGSWSGSRSVGTLIGARLRYAGHHELRNDGWTELHITSRDDATGLTVDTVFSTVDGLPAARTWARVRATGDEPVTVQSISSFAGTPFPAGAVDVDNLELYQGRSDWLAEGRWRRDAVREVGLPDLDLGLHEANPRGCFSAVSHGTWSTGEAMPGGVLTDQSSGAAVAWQIEHNGAWRWEIGERLNGVYLLASGPTDADHHWQLVLEPGDEFTTVPVGVAVSSVGGLEGAMAALTRYRRAIVRPHPTRDALPVIFNDYMNTLMGDPTTERLLPLIDAAASAGAEYFCIDAGWYDDGPWWDTVGAWEPATARFPGGLTEVIDRIRRAGMVPGLWLEPEVVGARSPIVDQLPDEAFFQHAGTKVAEHGRYHLDLRHPAAWAHLTGVVDRLVGELGVGYFKLDYNINPGVGTEVKAAAPGDGLLGHNRAYLAWLDETLDRHPGLVIENCASGAMRMDYAILSRLHLQSTSDQRNPLLYPPIAASAPMSVLPEQAGNWAYPQPEMSPEEIAFTMVTGLAGRLYLTGHLDRMNAEQIRLVSEGVTVHRAIRSELTRAVPIWPIGLPDWSDPWVAVGFRVAEPSRDRTYLAIWRRDGTAGQVSLNLPHLQGHAVREDIAFPAELPRWELTWDPELGVLTAAASGNEPAARLIELTPT